MPTATCQLLPPIYQSVAPFLVDTGLPYVATASCLMTTLQSGPLFLSLIVAQLLPVQAEETKKTEETRSEWHLKSHANFFLCTFLCQTTTTCSNSFATGNVLIIHQPFHCRTLLASHQQKFELFRVCFCFHAQSKRNYVVVLCFQGVI